jgi:hypothetical protein
MWYFDFNGNTGKSFMARYIKSEMDGFVVESLKTSDITYAYRGQKIVVFDLTRSCEKRVNYDIIEKFKNGTMFSGKEFEAPHVIIFANFRPEMYKLSLDRWYIVQICE